MLSQNSHGQAGARASAPAPSKGAAEARESSYDVVVVGAGIGGLTAGALLARAGKKVLVLEAEDRPGGYARALVRGPYTFDIADHLIWGCAPTGPFGPGVIDAVLRHLRVRDRCELIRMDDPVYQARMPGLELSVPHGRDAFLDAHLRHFPSESGGLRRLVETSAEIQREFLDYPLEPRTSDLALTARRFPELWRYRSATLEDVLDRELADPRLRAVYSALWGWMGASPSQASFMMWAILMSGYIEDGAYYCKGGFQSLADAFAAGLAEAGGELLLGTAVTRIHVERGRVQGVGLEGGQRVRAPLVISTIDPRDTFERLVGPQHTPSRLLRRLVKPDLSLSVLALYAATDLDVEGAGAQHDISLWNRWDHEQSLVDALAGRPSGLSILIPTLKDPSLAPPGEHLVILKAIAPSQAGLGERDDGFRADKMLELAELVLPELRKHITYLDHVDTAGPEGTSPLRLMGPMYGWAVTPRQTGARRLPQTTPLKGLVLAGQWSQPGPGVWTVVQSGITAARLALGRSAAMPALPLQL